MASTIVKPLPEDVVAIGKHTLEQVSTLANPGLDIVVRVVTSFSNDVKRGLNGQEFTIFALCVQDKTHNIMQMQEFLWGTGATRQKEVALRLALFPSGSLLRMTNVKKAERTKQGLWGQTVPNCIVMRDMGQPKKETVTFHAVQQDHPMAAVVPTMPLLSVPLSALLTLDAAMMVSFSGLLVKTGPVETTSAGDVVVITVRDATAVVDISLWLQSLPNFDIKDAVLEDMYTFLNIWVNMEGGVAAKCCNVKNKSAVLHLPKDIDIVKDTMAAISATPMADLPHICLPVWTPQESSTMTKTQDEWAQESAELLCCSLLHSVRLATEDDHFNGLKKISGCYLQPDLSVATHTKDGKFWPQVVVTDATGSCQARIDAEALATMTGHTGKDVDLLAKGFQEGSLPFFRGTIYLNRTTRTSNTGNDKHTFVNHVIVAAMLAPINMDIYQLPLRDRSEAIIPTTLGSLRPNLFGKMQVMMGTKRFSVQSVCACLAVVSITAAESFTATDAFETSRSVNVYIRNANGLPSNTQTLSQGTLVFGHITGGTFDKDQKTLLSIDVEHVQFFESGPDTEKTPTKFAEEIETISTLTVTAGKRMQLEETLSQLRTPEKKRRCSNISTTSSPCTEKCP